MRNIARHQVANESLEEEKIVPPIRDADNIGYTDATGAL
jgi:hypothetical protein